MWFFNVTIIDTVVVYKLHNTHQYEYHSLQKSVEQSMV